MKHRIIRKEKFSDERGVLCFANEFDMKDIRRFYIIEHTKEKIIRAWQGHLIEKKYFTVLDGEWTIYLIKMNQNGEVCNNEKVLEYNLISSSGILEIPGGYLTGLINNTVNSKLLVFSDKTLKESNNDDFRFEKDYFNVNW